MECIKHRHDSWNNLTLAGRTVGVAIDQNATIFNLPTNSTILVNGESVDRSYIIREGDTIELVGETGQKG
jgi:hypothetical protein